MPAKGPPMTNGASHKKHSRHCPARKRFKALLLAVSRGGLASLPIPLVGGLLALSIFLFLSSRGFLESLWRTE